jgi:O-antigen/teichoic acid export membrane protein
MLGAGHGTGAAGFGSQQEPMAVVSIVLCVVAIPIWGCCGPASLVATVAGVILGLVSIGRVHREPGRYSGKQLSIVGLVLNALFTLANLILLLFVVGMFGFGILSGP